MARMREKQSVEPRDKAFALYGIFRELGINMPPPDYRKQVGQVYREFTIAYMLAENNLNILYWVPTASRESIDGLVSWAPDFSSPDSMGGELATLGSFQAGSAFEGYTMFSASGKSRPRLTVTNYLSRLRLHLKLMDTVTYYGIHLYWNEAWIRGPPEVKFLVMLAVISVLGSWARASALCTAYPGPAKTAKPSTTPSLKASDRVLLRQS